MPHPDVSDHTLDREPTQTTPPIRVHVGLHLLLEVDQAVVLHQLPVSFGRGPTDGTEEEGLVCLLSLSSPLAPAVQTEVPRVAGGVPGVRAGGAGGRHTGLTREVTHVTRGGGEPVHPRPVCPLQSEPVQHVPVVRGDLPPRCRDVLQVNEGLLLSEGGREVPVTSPHVQPHVLYVDPQTDGTLVPRVVLSHQILILVLHCLSLFLPLELME